MGMNTVVVPVAIAMTVVLMVARSLLMVAMAVLMDARMIALFVLMSEVPGRR